MAYGQRTCKLFAVACREDDARLRRVAIRAVRGDSDHLVAERVDVRNVRVGDLGAHGDLGGGLHGCLEVLGENGGEVGGGSVCPEA